jgi:putative restriction endonuclease
MSIALSVDNAGAIPALTGLCVYALKNLPDLQSSLAKGGRDTYEEGKHWKRAQQLLDESRKNGHRVPILFGDADHIFFLVGWALLDDIRPGPTTTFTFSGLRLFRDAIPKSNLLKENGDDLPDHFRRSYAICRTPEFLSRVSTQEPVDALRQLSVADPAAGATETPSQISDPGQDETPVVEPADRRTVVSEQLVRDSAVVTSVKRLHDFHCQVCGLRLETPAGAYAQGAHIRPLGSPHEGPDVPENVVCLCPNHHILFDAGAFSVRDDLTLIPRPGLNLPSLGEQLHQVAGHRIGTDYLRHHRERFGFEE